MTQLHEIRYIIWDFNKNTPYYNELYDTLKGCKGAVSYILKNFPNNNIGIREFKLEPTGKSLKKVDNSWVELKGIAKLLYG